MKAISRNPIRMKHPYSPPPIHHSLLTSLMQLNHLTSSEKTSAGGGSKEGTVKKKTKKQKRKKKKKKTVSHPPTQHRGFHDSPAPEAPLIGTALGKDHQTATAFSQDLLGENLIVLGAAKQKRGKSRRSKRAKVCGSPAVLFIFGPDLLLFGVV